MALDLKLKEEAVLLATEYQAPWYLPNGHWQTIGPHLLRQPMPLPYRRERMTLPDGDFLDLDHASPEHCTKDVHILLLHGLEGNSRSSYLQSLGHVLLRAGYSITAINFRGCSGEPNLLPRFYHSGATEDVAATVLHLSKLGKPLIIMGFSLGGNQTLKFMGELADKYADLAPVVQAAMAVSVPLDLDSCSSCISHPTNFIYERRFVKSLCAKIAAKYAVRPHPLLAVQQLPHIYTLRQFDAAYTAPLHGYESAEAYYAANSSLHYLEKIQKLTLLLQAENDPFLSELALPSRVDNNRLTYLKTHTGGHCGWLAAKGTVYARSGGPEFINEMALWWLSQL